MKIDKRWIRGALGAGVVALSLVSLGASSDRKDPDEFAGARPKRVSVTAQEPVEAARPASIHIELESLKRAEDKEKAEVVVGSAFGVTSWYVPPPPPPPPPPSPPPPPPPPPSAPPLPFSYLGQYQDAATQFVILTKGDRVYTASPGDIVDGTYSIDRIAAGQIELTYLPLNIKQSIAVGGES